MFDIIAWVMTEAIHSLSKQMAISFLSTDLSFYCSSFILLISGSLQFKAVSMWKSCNTEVIKIVAN